MSSFRIWLLISAVAWAGTGCTSSTKTRAAVVGKNQQAEMSFSACPRTISLIDISEKHGPMKSWQEGYILARARLLSSKLLRDIELVESEGDINLTFTRAYAQHVAGTRSTVVVAELTSPLLKERVMLRGNTVGTNWMGSDNEIRRALEDSIRTILDSVATSTQAPCGKAAGSAKRRSR